MSLPRRARDESLQFIESRFAVLSLPETVPDPYEVKANRTRKTPFPLAPGLQPSLQMN